MPDPAHFETYLREGASLHQAGRLEQALVAFERALALRPDSPNAASACATMLTALDQPAAAYRVLLTVQSQLLQHPDGATNLAIGAEACGQWEQAHDAYARALELDPNHQRALNNTALLMARSGDWQGAIDRLERCVALSPDDPAPLRNLADILIGARRFGPAASLLASAVPRFPADPGLLSRQVLALAFDGEIEAAQRAIDHLDTASRAQLQELLARANTSGSRIVRKLSRTMPDAYELFCRQAFDAMQECDWRDHDRLTAVIREMLARAIRTGQGRDGRDTQFYGLLLPLQEDELAQIRSITIDTIGKSFRTPLAPFVASRIRGRDNRIHVGLATQNLADPRVANAIEQQLRHHDRSRFAIHLYSPTPKPDFALTARLAELGASAVEIAHMTDDEAVSRIRLDQLDIFVDTAFDTPWCRPEIPERRVAPVQLRQTTWHRHHPPRPCEYNMSDTFVHPDGIDMEKYGAVVRLPTTCWLATNDEQPDGRPVAREQVGLPQNGLVLCSFLPSMMIDPQTFALWVQMLMALPGSVLWLPSYGNAARSNLSRSAAAAGLDPARLLYMAPCSRPEMLARMRLADLFVDALRFNANHGLVDVLRMGVPALSCAGDNMASRLGGSILRAAGLADCVFDSHIAYRNAVVALGQSPERLLALRARVALQHESAPLFNPRGRVREWEAAWTVMVERHRDGRPPIGFDVTVPDAVSSYTVSST